MSFSVLVLLSLAVLALVGIICQIRIARDRGREGKIGRAGAAMIWFVYLGFTALAVGVAWKGVWALPLPLEAAWGLGAALMLAGAVFLLSGMTAFGSVKRMSGQDNGRLIRAGVYRWSRNPQNVGWALGLFGVALLGRSGLALVFACIFAVAFYLYVPVEERYLETVFGEEWRRYRNEVPRLFGLPAPAQSARRESARGFRPDDAKADAG